MDIYFFFERMTSLVDKKLLQSHSIFPTLNIEQTAAFYSQYLGFKAVPYLDTQEPHLCLYRDDTEIILTQSHGQRSFPIENCTVMDTMPILLRSSKKSSRRSSKPPVFILFVLYQTPIIITRNL